MSARPLHPAESAFVGERRHRPSRVRRAETTAGTVRPPRGGEDGEATGRVLSWRNERSGRDDHQAVWQVRAIVSSDAPRLHTVRAVVIGVSTLLVVFASTYSVISNSRPDSFTEIVFAAMQKGLRRQEDERAAATDDRAGDG